MALPWKLPSGRRAISKRSSEVWRGQVMWLIQYLIICYWVWKYHKLSAFISHYLISNHFKVRVISAKDKIRAFFMINNLWFSSLQIYAESFTSMEIRDWALVLLKEKEKRSENENTVTFILLFKKKIQINSTRSLSKRILLECRNFTNYETQEKGTTKNCRQNRKQRPWHSSAEINYLFS